VSGFSVQVSAQMKESFQVSVFRFQDQMSFLTPETRHLKPTLRNLKPKGEKR